MKEIYCLMILFKTNYSSLMFLSRQHLKKDTELPQKRLKWTLLPEHYCCLQNDILWLYLLDCKMPSFGQACSITIPMNISPQWKISLETIPRLKCCRERIRIALALWRKQSLQKLQQTWNKLPLIHYLTGDARVIFHVHQSTVIKYASQLFT